MVNIPKFYKEKEIEYEGQKLTIRASRPDDAPEVGKLMENKFAQMDLGKKLKASKKKEPSNEDQLELLKLMNEEGQIADILANRAIKRVETPENSTLLVKELDELPNHYLDAEAAKIIAWAMVNLGIPETPVAGKKKIKTEKNSQQETT